VTHPYIAEALAAERIRDLHEAARRQSLVAAARSARSPSHSPRLRHWWTSFVLTRAAIAIGIGSRPRTKPEPGCSSSR
jgi:hypothetical protein